MLRVELTHPTPPNTSLKEVKDEETFNVINRLSMIDRQDPFKITSFTFWIKGISKLLSNKIIKNYDCYVSEKTLDVIEGSQFEIVEPNVEDMDQKVDFYNSIYGSLARKIVIDEIVKSNNYEEWYEKITKLEEKDGNWSASEIFKTLYHGNTKDVDKYINVFKDSFEKEYEKINKKVFDELEYITPSGLKIDIVINIGRNELHKMLSENYNTENWELKELVDQIVNELKVFL